MVKSASRPSYCAWSLVIPQFALKGNANVHSSYYMDQHGVNLGIEMTQIIVTNQCYEGIPHAVPTFKLRFLMFSVEWVAHTIERVCDVWFGV